MEEQERERRRQVVEKFQKAPFEEIAAHCGARVQRKNIFLSEILVFKLFFALYCFLILYFFLSLLGHTTTEQTQSDLWDNNQVRNNSFWKGDKWQWHWLKLTMMMRTLFSSLTDPRPAHLELFRQVTAKARVDLSPSTRWSSLIFAFTRPERPQRSYRAV